MDFGDTYEFFLAALNEWIEETGYGYKKILAVGCDCGKSYMTQLLDPKRQKPIPFEYQVKMAETCGYSYIDFLQHGKALIEGQKEGKPTPMDPAIRIMEEALEETGVKINEKQKMAVIKIIREELEKSKHHTKDDIKRYLDAFGK